MDETRAAVERTLNDFLERCEEYPKATACLARDRGQLLACHDYRGQLAKVVEAVPFNDGIEVVADSRAAA